MRLLMAVSMALPSLYWAPVFASSAPVGLADACNLAYIKSVLPPSGLITGITPSPYSVKANAVVNYAVQASNTNPGKSGLDFCNVTFSYSHAGLNDKVRVCSSAVPSRPA